MASARETASSLVGSVAAVVTVLVLVVGGPFVYFHFIEGDRPRRRFARDDADHRADSRREPRAVGGNVEGRQPGSLVRYRVKETLFGQSNTGTGQTERVTGSITIVGTEVTKASFIVDMTSFTSDESQPRRPVPAPDHGHRRLPHGRRSSSPARSTLGTERRGRVQTRLYRAGKLTMHGTTKAVTFPLDGAAHRKPDRRAGERPVTFADYGIDNPSGGPSSVGSSGQMEFVIELTPA